MVSFIQQKGKREQKCQTIRNRSCPQNPFYAQEDWKNQRCGHKKDDLARKGQNGGFDRFAHRLQIDRRDGLESGQRTKHQKDAKCLDGKLVVQTLFGAKQRHHAHRGKLEDQKGCYRYDLRGDQRDLQRLFHAVIALCAVVVSDNRLGAGGDAQQNGDHDLVYLHDDTGRGQWDFCTINRLRAVFCQQVVGQRHDDGDGKLGDKAAQSEDHDVHAHLCAGSKARFVQLHALKMRHVEHRYHKGRYLTDDGCNRCSLDPPSERQR